MTKASGRVSMTAVALLAVVLSGTITACGRDANADVLAPTATPAALGTRGTTGVHASPATATPTATPTAIAIPTPTATGVFSPAKPAASPGSRPVTPPPAAPPAERVAASTTAGIDVSKWQPEIDWNDVHAAGYRFAFVSAVGSTGDNPHFSRQWSGAKAAGVYRGAYYFGDPTTGTGKAHAARFLGMVGDMRDGRTLRPMLDVERHPHQVACNGVGRDVWVEYVRSFVAEVKSRIGVTPIIYTGKSFWRECVGDTTAFARDTLLFAAQWNVPAPDVFGGWRKATFWQHTNTGRVPGINGNIDLDIFFGAPSDLQGLTVPQL